MSRLQRSFITTVNFFTVHIITVGLVLCSGALMASETKAVERLLIIGDSLTAGYGLQETQAYPALLQQRLQQDGHSITVVNGGLSGDTTTGGLTRLAWLLRSKPDLVLIALGANDGLRGMDVSVSQANLSKMIEQCQQAGARVALAGIDLPTNYGDDYRHKFTKIFPALAKKYDVPLLPFLLEGVAMNPELNLADGIHPNEAGQKIVAHTVQAFITPLLHTPHKSGEAQEMESPK